MEQDDRTKKLLAGKERLAAFQRKRAKRKKKKDTEDGASDYTWSESSSIADLSDVASTGDFSDAGSVVDENDRTVVGADFSEGESDGSYRSKPERKVSNTVALVRARSSMKKMTDRITKLEEVLQGKEDVMSHVLEENEQLRSAMALKSQADSNSDLNLSASGSLEEQGSAPDDKESDDTYQQKLDEVEEALRKRDEVIAQLTQNLQATTVSRDTLQQEYTEQATELARQVQTLQLQLQQAGEWLKNHMGEHGISAQALLEAKNELLALQQVNSHKKQELAAARTAILERDNALQKVVEQYKTAAEQANLLHQEYTRLQHQNLQYASQVEHLTQVSQQAESERETLKQQVHDLSKNNTSCSETPEKEPSTFKQELADNQSKIESLEKALQERDGEVSKLKEIVTQKDHSLQQMVLSLSSVGGSDSALQEQLGQQQKEVTHLQDIIQHKDQLLQQLNEKFSETSQQLQSLYREVSALKEKEQEVLVLQQTIQEREKTVATLQNTVKVREERLSILEKTITEQVGKEGNNSQQLLELADRLKAVSEESESLRAAANERQVLQGKLEQLGQQYIRMSEENSQLKEASNEIAVIAEKIPQLSSEIQRLGEENKVLKQKENEMYQLVEQMKDRERFVTTLNEECQELKVKGESLQKDNHDLQAKLESMGDLSDDLNQMKSKYSTLVEKVESQEKENNEKNEQLAAIQEKYENAIEESRIVSEENKFLTTQVKEMSQRLKNAEQEKEVQQRSSDDVNAVQNVEISEMKQQLATFQEAVQKRDSSLGELSETVSRLTNQVMTLSEENQRLTEETKNLEHLKIELDKANGELSSFKTNLEKKEQTLLETRNSVNTMEQEIQLLSEENKSLKEAQNEIQSLKDQVGLREREAREAQKIVSQKDEDIEKMSASIAQLNSEMNNLSTKISEKEEEVANLNLNLKETIGKFEESSEKMQQLESENRALQQKSADFETLQNTAVAEKDKLIMELQENIRSKQMELESLQRDVSKNNEDVIQYRQVSESLTKQLTNAKSEVAEKDQINQGLRDEVASQKVTIDGYVETLKEEQASLEEFREKIELLTEQIKSATTDQKHLQEKNQLKDDEIAALQKSVNEYETWRQKFEEENSALKEELENLKLENENLQEKEDLLIKTQGEVAILQETIKERDDTLTALTESMSKLTQEVTEMSEVNSLLRTREEELTEAQKNVHDHLQAVNEQIAILKKENEKLTQKETEKQGKVEDSDSRYEEISEKFAALQKDYENLQLEQNKMISLEEEHALAKEEMDRMAVQLSEVESQSVALKDKNEEISHLQEQLTVEKESKSALTEQIRILTESLEEAKHHQNESASALGASNDTVNNELSQTPTQNETLNGKQDQDIQNEQVREIQAQLETAVDENKKLKERIDELCSAQKTEAMNVQVSDEVVANRAENIVQETSEDTDSDVPVVEPLVREESLTLNMAAPLTGVTPSVGSDDLKDVVEQKDRDIQTLHQTVQTQHQALQELHQRATELTQYVTYLSQENQQLKSQTASQVEPGVEGTNEKSTEEPTGQSEETETERLQKQIDDHKAAFSDMSERYVKLVEENQAMKLKLDQKIAEPTTESLRLETTQSADESPDGQTGDSVDQKDAEITSLRAYIQQQSAHIEQVTVRMNEMAHYVTQVQEQNTALREQNEKTTKVLQDMAQTPEKAGENGEEIQAKKEVEELQSSLALSSESLTKLDEENKMLKQREKESSEVVQQLMQDIENIRRSRSHSPTDSSAASLGGSVGIDQHEQAMAMLRAELEEQHGEQIVEMKEQLREQLTQLMNEQIKVVTSQRDEALARLQVQDHSSMEPQPSSEEELSLTLEVKQLQVKLKDFEGERAEYVTKVRELQEKHSEELREVVNQRDQSNAIKEEAVAKMEEQSALVNSEKDLREVQEKQLEILNQRLMELMSERDEALDKADKFEQLHSQHVQLEQEKQDKLALDALNHDKQIEEMSQQIQQLKTERDEVVAQVQELMVRQEPPDQQSNGAQDQVIETLRKEIEALNTQKEDAMAKIQQLHRDLETQRKENPEGGVRDGDAKEVEVAQQPATPTHRKISPTHQKPLSPMQQQLLHLQQQLLQDSPPPVPDEVQTELETQAATGAEAATPSTEIELSPEQDTVKSDVRLKQMQEIYDQHCKHQAHQIEQLTADLNKATREREELMAQLEQYQKHYESHVKTLVEQQKQEAGESLKAIHEELNAMKKERDEVTERLESLQSQHKSQVRELTDQLKGWKSKYQEVSLNFTGDGAVALSRVHAEGVQLQNDIDELKSKLESSEKEKEDAKAQVKELQIAYYDLEGKNPEVASYRTRLEDIESTLKVTWIENEELKAEVATLKSTLKNITGDADTPTDAANGVIEDTETLKARLTAAEAELERLHPLVGVEVIVIVRQMEELRNTYSNQLRIHNQELTAVKRELARYQSLDSDSSESPIHAVNNPVLGAKPTLERTESLDSINIELGRVQAEHQLEVESLKKTKGEFAEELYAEKERHRDAMARIEQLLKKMVKMQQKHKEEIETLKKADEEKLHQMSVELAELKAHSLVNSSNGVGGDSEMKIHFDQIISEKQRLLTERDGLLRDKQDWDAERDRLKGRIAQVVGEKDLIAKEQEKLSRSLDQLERDKKKMETQQKLLATEKQQLVFEREQLTYKKDSVPKGKRRGKKGGDSHSQADRLASLEAEVAMLRQYKDQVLLLQQERALLVDDHRMEINSLHSENGELKQKLDQAESEKRREIENIKEEFGFEITELQLRLETVEQEQGLRPELGVEQLQQSVEQLQSEKEELLKEYSSKAVTQLAEWKLQRDEMEEEYNGKLQSELRQQENLFTPQIDELKTKLAETTDDAETARKERDAIKEEHGQILEALRAQEAELVKLQNACSRIKEERDTLQAEHMRMLDSLQQDGADTVAQLSQQIQHLNQERQIVKDGQTQAVEALQREYEASMAEQQRVLDETVSKHNQDLQECNARYEAEIEAYKVKHGEVLEEVHTLRRENYEMRTVISDPRTQQHMIEVAKTSEVFTQSPRDVPSDSLSPNRTTASEAERDFQGLKEEYVKKLCDLNESHKKDIQETEYSLSEKYELSKRQLKVEHQIDLEDQAKKLKQDHEREVERQLKLARIANERKFVEELQNARRELSERYTSQVDALRRQYEQGSLHQVSGQSARQLEDVITRLQIENQDLGEARAALLQQIDKAHGHQEELQEEVTAVSTQKDALIAENLQLQQRVAQLTQDQLVQNEPNWHPLSQQSVKFQVAQLPAQSSDTEHQQLLEKYAELLSENQRLRERPGSQEKATSPSIVDSLEGSLEPPDAMSRLQDELQSLQSENQGLRNHLEDQNLAAHEELGELQGKYIQLVAENETLRAQLQCDIPEDSLDELVVDDLDMRETQRLQSRYATIAQENEVLRAKLGSYGLPTESVAEEENLDLSSRYELIRKENEALRAKLEAYTHQGAIERDGRWKEKYDAILQDYATLRSQLEELGLPINDSIQKGLEELQVKFDQVVKEKETLQGKLSTVRENAEQDFRELQSRHSELHATHKNLAKEYGDLKSLLEKDKDKSKRECVKIRSKLSNVSKEMDTWKAKFEKATKETEALKSKLDQAEGRLRQEGPSTAAPSSAAKGKKRKQERGGHGKGRKQRREADALDDSVEMADQSLQEEFESLKSQYTTVVKENDTLKSEVGGLKCELGSLKSRLMDSLRHRLRDPPVAHSTPLDSDLTHSARKHIDIDSTPTGLPQSERVTRVCAVHEGEGATASSVSELDLTSPKGVEALRVRYEDALQELSEMRKELDRMNSKALDELMGLQSEADALEEENASMKQALHTDGTASDAQEENDSQGDARDGNKQTHTFEELQQHCKQAQQQLTILKKQFEDVKAENEDLRDIIGRAAGSTDHVGDTKEDFKVLRKDIDALHLKHRTVHSESEIIPVREKAQLTAASAELLPKEKAKRTVSLGSVDVGVTVNDLAVDIEFEKPSLIQKSYSMNTVIPKSALEGGQLEAEWKRILRMRSRAASAGDAITEEGFHPEADPNILANKQVEGFIPASPGMEPQVLWPPRKADSPDLPLMSIEEEFKLQLESMVANFGEKNVREQLGRDYVEIHQKFEASQEDNERLMTEVIEARDQVVKLTKRVSELDIYRQEPGTKKVGFVEDESEVFVSEELPETNGEDEVEQLKQDMVRLKDENELLLQENSTLEAQYESRSAKSAWQETVLKGDIESELQHLRGDKAKLEDEMSKIKALYAQVKEHSEKLSAENEELSIDKLRLEQELHVLRSVLEALKQEQAKVEVEIQERVDVQEARDREDVGEAQGKTLEVESAKGSKKMRKKSPSPLDRKEKEGQQVGKGGKKGKKSASPAPEQPVRRTSSPSTSTSSKESVKAAIPMRLLKEPPTKVKKTSQSHLQASRESLVAEDKVGNSQLKQKLKELTAKNKTLQVDVDVLKKALAAADRTKDILKLQSDNKALLKELEEMRGSLKSQGKLLDQMQDMRTRLEALVKEKDTLKKENVALSDRINDGVSPPMMEFEELKVQNQNLAKANQSLTEKLDRDLMQAEQELVEMKDKFKMAQMEKNQIEDEYKNVKDRLEKELYNVQSMYDEVVEERDLLETQLINTREHAEKDYQQLQAGHEEMRNEFEELQRAYDNEKEKARKDLNEIKSKLESSKQDNEELKKEIVVMRDDGDRGKTGLQQQCAMLQEDKHNLSREMKDYQNRLTAVEKSKEDVEKQLKDLKTRYQNLEKYHEEEKTSAEEENEFLKRKVESLKEEYDAISETLEELKMEKNNLNQELNDSHAWCETLEMNLKETESSMQKETVTLKEELRFISEKLETETSVRNNLASAEEELRQKLIDTSQELDRVRRDALASKDKLNAKLETLHTANSDLTKQLELVQEKLAEKELEVETCNTELVNARETHNELVSNFSELKEKKEAIENEYRQMRNKFGVTESELVEFRKSYLTENVESERLLSRFRAQFEQVTKERDGLKAERDQLNQHLEEARAKYTVQREDNRVLRRAIGAEVDVRFQTVNQIESILGDDKPPMSPVSPLCRSPAVSESGSECSEEFGPNSEALIGKLQRQNTSLALLIQELANIKVTRDREMSRISAKYQSVQASLNESVTSYNQDRSQLEADVELLKSQNEELVVRAQETEAKLQDAVERSHVLEEELLRLQRTGADGASSSTPATKEIQKYVVEMEDDVLTVSTLTIPADGEVGQDQGSTVEAMQCSPQLSTPSVISINQEPTLQANALTRRNTDPELAKLKDKTWEGEYLALQEKYMALLKEHEKIWQRVQQSPIRAGQLDLEGELTIEVTDSSVIELIEENSKLHALNTKLENELMSQRIDCLEVDAAYTELTWLKEQKTKLEEKLRLQHHMYEQEKQMLEHRLNELQASLDKLLCVKRKTSEEAQTLKHKYTELLAVSSDEVKELAEQAHNPEEREKVLAKLAEKERIAVLESQVKCEQDEKEFLQVQVSHLKKECELYERHVRDLEKEIDEQYAHLHEASREHKTMVQLLAETKLELELNREKHQQVEKIGQTVERIEAQLSGRSTPQSAMMHSPPMVVTTHSGSASPSPQPLLLADSRTSTQSCDDGSAEEAQRVMETSRIVDEMVQLRHEIMEAKAMYHQESSLLKRAQQQSKTSPAGEHSALKEELAVIEEQNELLKRENEDLQKRLTEQEELVFHLQTRLSSSDSTDDGKDTLEAVFVQQLALIKAERDDLQGKLSALEQRQHKNRDLLREKTLMEESFNQEREALKQKLHVKEMNEFELVRKIAALERHIREQQRLEEFAYHKSSLEDEIRRQKESFDHELLDVEKKLQDQRNMIRIERVKLLGELKQKHWQKILSQDDGESMEPVSQLGHRDKPRSMASGFERLSRMKAEVEQRYREAIDRLRHELHADYQSSSHGHSPSQH